MLAKTLQVIMLYGPDNSPRKWYFLVMVKGAHLSISAFKALCQIYQVTIYGKILW